MGSQTIKIEPECVLIKLLRRNYGSRIKKKMWGPFTLFKKYRFRLHIFYLIEIPEQFHYSQLMFLFIAHKFDSFHHPNNYLFSCHTLSKSLELH